ncbi:MULTISPECIES: NADH-quinone oxidoreductase subunit N [Nocardiopsis]|uniref:NADH-quinone oxidoreductase subunit N n=1 Tax=Nocardiopsis sinuspersici TaxID=501010 RepID=A0A1V3C8H6_9ACTN|nr:MULTISPECIES: NADH-quinone oxidoreductase subunit N [Nocardiopsis]OOC57003.1 NADH-quinone oxidoreductase subunit N [Nocardiopsis sinuspersici]
MESVDPLTLLPELILALAAVGALLFGSWTPRRRQGRVRLCVTAALLAALAATLVAAATGTGSDSGGHTVDTATHAVRVVVLVGVLATVLLAADTFAAHPRESEFHVLLLLAALGTMALAGASDLLVLAAAYLLASIPLYALVGFAKDSPGTEAALKFYLLGALSGILLLTGATLLLGAGGTTGYAGLADALPGAPRALVAAGVIAVLAGLLFKAGGVPVHFWVPDVAEGAPAPVAAFVTTVPKIGALAALYRWGDQVLAGAAPDWALPAALLAAASMTLGNLGAFLQTDARRLLGYSTVSQVGYLLMAVAAVGGRADLVQPGLLFYLGAYTAANLGAFAVVCALRARTLEDHAGLFRDHPWLALSLVVCLLGLVGTPPTAVFVGKLALFTAALEADLGWLMVLAAVNTVASLFYYLRWILPLFRASGEPPEERERSEPPGRWSTGVAVTAAAASLGMGIAAGPVLGLL